jgi:hypothetical protein
MVYTLFFLRRPDRSQGEIDMIILNEYFVLRRMVETPPTPTLFSRYLLEERTQTPPHHNNHMNKNMVYTKTKQQIWKK